eukprot:1483824-Rhodomonas_salina.1
MINWFTGYWQDAQDTVKLQLTQKEKNSERTGACAMSENNIPISAKSASLQDTEPLLSLIHI